LTQKQSARQAGRFIKAITLSVQQQLAMAGRL
jgi:hypothetical protein